MARGLVPAWPLGTLTGASPGAGRGPAGHRRRVPARQGRVDRRVRRRHPGGARGRGRSGGVARNAMVVRAHVRRDLRRGDARDHVAVPVSRQGRDPHHRHRPQSRRQCGDRLCGAPQRRSRRWWRFRPDICRRPPKCAPALRMRWSRRVSRRPPEKSRRPAIGPGRADFRNRVAGDLSQHVRPGRPGGDPEERGGAARHAAAVGGGRFRSDLFARGRDYAFSRAPKNPKAAISRSRPAISPRRGRRNASDRMAETVRSSSAGVGNWRKERSAVECRRRDGAGDEFSDDDVFDETSSMPP